MSALYYGAAEKDSYNHTFPANHKVVKGHYLEIFKETKDGDVYYLDDNKTALILCFVVGICPDLNVVQIKRQGKIVSMNLMKFMKLRVI